MPMLMPVVAVIVSIFDTNSTVACSNADWDLKLEIAGYDWNLWTNNGISGEGDGGAFGPFTTVEADGYTAGHITSGGTNIANHYSTDISAGIFADNLWYAYNLEGAHKLWPNYRTYVIDTDSSDENAPVYKLQITDYYSNIGTSGHPSIRYVKID